MKLGLSLLLISLSCILYSQKASLVGTVKLIDDSNPQGTIIQILDKKDKNLLSSTVADSAGFFRIGNLPSREIEVYFYQFGYQDTAIYLNIDKKELKLPIIVLKSLNILIDEISVFDKLAIARKSGDSTIFNLNAIETGFEQSTSDILKKIPGLEVSSNRYQYNGKDIEVMQINGLEQSGDYQVGLTNAVLYASVDKISIIEKLRSELSQVEDSSDKYLVLDLKLKEAYNSKWQTTASISSGYQNLVGSENTLIRANKRSTYFFLLKGNNFNDVLEDDIFESIKEEIDLENKLSNTLIRLSKGDRFSTNSINNSNIFGFFKATHSLKINEKSYQYSELKVEKSRPVSESDGQRIYINNNQVEFIKKTEQTEKFRVHFLTKYNNKLNSKSSLNFKFPIRFNSNDLKLESSLLWVNRPIENLGVSQNDQVSLAPSFEYNLNSKNYSFELTGNYSFSQMIGSINNKSSTKLAGLNQYNNDNRLFSVQQERNLSNSRNEFFIDFRSKELKFKPQLVSNFIKNSEELTLQTFQTNGEDKIERDQLSTVIINSKIKAIIENRKLRFVPMISSGYVNIKYKSFEINKSYIFPQALILYKISELWRSSISNNVSLIQPLLYQYTDLKSVESETTETIGLYPLSRVGQRISYNFSVFQDPVTTIQKGRTILLSASYSPSAHEIQPVYEFKDGFQLQRWESILSEDLMSYGLNLRQKLEKLNLSARANYSTIRINLPTGRTNDNMLNTNIFASYTYPKLGSISSNYSFYNTMRNSENNQTNNTRHQIEVNINYFKGRYDQLFLINQSINRFDERKNNYTNLSYILSIKKVLKKFDISFSLLDILNLNSAPLQINTINENYFETLNFQNLPGRILIKVSGYF